MLFGSLVINPYFFTQLIPAGTRLQTHKRWIGEILGSWVDKGGFPLSRNFYVRVHVIFTRVNEIEPMCGRSRAKIKVGPRSTLRNALPFIYHLYFIDARKNYATVEIHFKSRSHHVSN